jgi:hypothetical protein
MFYNLSVCDTLLEFLGTFSTQHQVNEDFFVGVNILLSTGFKMAGFQS